MPQSSFIAAARSSATSFSSSSSFISVSSISAPPPRSSPASCFFDSISSIDLILDGAAADELVHQHILVLADAEGPVGGLVFDRRIPPSVEMDDMRGGGQVEPGAPGLERQHEERDIVVLLESPHQLLALRHRRPAVQHEARPPEDGAEERRQRLRSSP